MKKLLVVEAKGKQGTRNDLKEDVKNIGHNCGRSKDERSERIDRKLSEVIGVFSTPLIIKTMEVDRSPGRQKLQAELHCISPINLIL
ncbi:hypothetical protein [Candidatus Neptunichlamydia sp. REUL1]|uniref:hypothetical protein n=1 Tax=Candidatus Neptunichlamydia sp. REUL1 TaxID=3064277 RepID=UPI0029304CC5|nr:hypothetical protein [Candidatus Neptunochlamydia sp. REUL1]